MKVIGYIFFAMIYYICRMFPMRKNQIFAIMTHDDSMESNVGMVVKYLKKKSNKYTFYFMKKKDTNYIKSKKIKEVATFFLIKPYQIATSSYILQDNIFLPFSMIRFSKKVKVIQLWHGTGTIKKFGQDVNKGLLKSLEKNANKTITHLIINSKPIKSIYQAAFGIDSDKIFVYGSPRTDLLWNESRALKEKEEFYKKYTELKEKKIILYAPTFRDNEVAVPKVLMDFKRMLSVIPIDYIIGLRLHPHVARYFSLSENMDERVYDFSSYNNLNSLLRVTDLLITDYSSIIFDYCILGKPMIFYAYDLSTFSDNGRGFYKDYNKLVPGQVAKTMEELLVYIKLKNYNLKIIEEFTNYYHEYKDGKSTQRIVENIFE